MKKLYLIPFFILLTFGLVLNGWAEPKGELIIAENDFVYESFDPTNMRTFFGDCLYDNIMDHDEKGNPVPALAESYSLSPDGKTWTFKIRKGVTWHNGDPLTSADFKWSIQRFAGPKSTNPWARSLRNALVSMETPDEYTFVFHAKKAESMLIEPFIAVQIVPKKYMEKVGDEEFQKAPIGTGPWKYVKFVSGERMEMVANEDYWGGAPYFKKLTFLEIPEESTQIAMLKRGEIDRTSTVSHDRAAQMRDKGWRLLPSVTPRVGNIVIAGVWDTDAPTKDIRVRQAMSYALNREEWAHSMFLGFAKPGGRFSAYPGTWGWDPNWGTDPYDPAKAKSLLKQAGYPQKFQNPVIKVYATTRRPTPDMMQVLAGYWEAVGIKTRIINMENAEFGQYFFRRSNPKNKEVVFGAVLPFIYFAAPNNVYHAANCFNTRGIHPIGYDPKCDELYGKLMQERDPEKAKQYYRDWMNYARSLYISIPTLMIYDQYIYGPKIGKFTKYSRSSFKRLAGVTPAK